MSERLDELVEAADLNGLLRAVDELCSAARWDELVKLADACEEAIERGKQLWAIAAHVDYRLALEAPGDYAAGVLHADAERFALGPLSEVAASSHTWDELADHIEDPQAAAYVAQERVLRGEALEGDERAHAEVLELPPRLEPWEPAYALASYKPSYVEVAEPRARLEDLAPVPPRPGELLEDEELSEALLDLVRPWTTESNGAAQAVVAAPDSVAAASALTASSLRMGALRPDEAIGLTAWAAASGGAHGRRRGGAFGRFSSWYLAALATGLAWPVEPSELGDAVSRLRWFAWDEGMIEKGWVLRIAFEHPEDSWGAAISASDLLEEE